MKSAFLTHHSPEGNSPKAEEKRLASNARIAALNLKMIARLAHSGAPPV